MSHCIRCGQDLPAAGAACPECRIKFDDVVEDSAFIDDDDDFEEEESPPQRARRAARWDQYLESSPVFAGSDDAPDDVDEPVVAEIEPLADEAEPMLHEDEPVTAEVEPLPADVTLDASEAPPVTIEPLAEDVDEDEDEDPPATEAITAPTGVLVVLPLDDADDETDDALAQLAEQYADDDATEDVADDVQDEPLPEPVVQETEAVEVEATDGEPAADLPPLEPAALEPAFVEPPAAPVIAPLAAPVVAPIASPVVTPMASLPARDVHTGPTDVRITTRFEFHSVPAEASPVVHALLDIEPSGAPLVDGTDGPLAHVVLALDLSASMNDPRKYPVLTRAIENMLDDLRHGPEGDVLISLVVFAYGAEILLRAQPASELDPREVLALIDRSPLRFSRYTDMVGALTRAGRIAYDSHRAMPRVPVRIYVLTDGRPQDVEGAREKMALIRRIPVDVNGLAFGNDADLGTLQDLICGGRGGTVKHVRSETLSSAFERIAEVARRVVAKRALLDVELKGGVVGGASYRFRPARHSYGKNAFRGGTEFRTDLGTLESGRHYSLLLQLRLPPTEADETEIGRVTLRIPGEGGPVTFERLLFVTRHPGAETPEADAIVVEARHVVEAVGADDPQAQLKALRARRRLYTEERRDPYIIELIDRAIEQMETKGSLDALSNGERAALQSHTQSVVGMGA